MLKSSDLYNISYYKKACYTGSMHGMRYLIEKADDNDTATFRVWVFPGPFCFAKTDDRLKEFKTFPFREESIPLIADWLNEKHLSFATTAPR